MEHIPRNGTKNNREKQDYTQRLRSRGLSGAASPSLETPERNGEASRELLADRMGDGSREERAGDWSRDPASLPLVEYQDHSESSSEPLLLLETDVSSSSPSAIVSISEIISWLLTRFILGAFFFFLRRRRFFRD